MTDREPAKGFWLRLLERRVPQILSIYCGVGWGLIQFTEWLVARFDISKNAPQVVFLVLLSLIPSVATIAYVRGANFWNKKWTWVEGIGVPANLGLTLLLLLNIIPNRSPLEPAPPKEDPVASMPKSTKKVVLVTPIAFEGEPEHQWMGTALPVMICYDLAQDLRIDATAYDQSPLIYRALQKQPDSDPTNATLGFWREQARQMSCERIIAGTIRYAQNQWQMTSQLLDVETLSVLAEREDHDEDWMNLVDQFAELVRTDFPNEEPPVDLPFTEIFTPSHEAARACAAAFHALWQTNYQECIEHARTALEHDPNFTLAQMVMGIQLANNNQSQESLRYLELAMQNADRLPERYQFDLRGIYFLLNGDVDKSMDLYAQQVNLYPDDHNVRLRYARLLITHNRPHEALEQYEIAESQFDDASFLWREIASTHEKLGNKDKALELLQKLVEHKPKDPDSHTFLGTYYMNEGQFDLARKSFETGILLKPNDLGIMEALADVKMKTGDWEGSVSDRQKIVEKAQSPIERAAALRRLLMQKVNMGQDVLALIDQTRAETAKFSPPVGVAINDLLWIRTYVSSGDLEKAEALLEGARTLQPPFDSIVALGEIAILLDKGEFETAQMKLDDNQAKLEALGAIVPFLKTFPSFVQGEVHMKSGHYEDAIQAFESYNASLGKYFGAESNLCEAYYESGQMDKALKTAQDGFRTFPADPRLNLWAAKIYANQGEQTLAKEHLQKALKAWAHADETYNFVKEARELAIELGLSSS
ncbi:MAG: tetratricopeptide repeat protein [Acidobacteria bacterium]|nr:tetratricopeptide repeat protein [Acidobacteriota bacterium]